MTASRTWAAGDNEPDDRPTIIDSHQDRWWHSGDGWRSAIMSYSERSKTWWWLSMYRGPLREEQR